MNMSKYNIGHFAAPAIMGAMCFFVSPTARAATITFNPGGDNDLYCSSAGGSISASAPLPSGFSNGILAMAYSSGSAWDNGTCAGAPAPANVEAMKVSLWVMNHGVPQQCYAFANGDWIYNTADFFGVSMALLPGQSTPLGPVWVSYQNLCGSGDYTLFIQTAVKNTTNGNTTWNFGTFQTPWTSLSIL